MWTRSSRVKVTERRRPAPHQSTVLTQQGLTYVHTEFSHSRSSPVLVLAAKLYSIQQISVDGDRKIQSILCNLFVGKYTLSVKASETFKLLPTSLSLPSWEAMVYSLQAEQGFACLCPLALERLNPKGV